MLDGQNVNQYAFIGNYHDLADENITIEYLTIQNFHSSQGGGAVNGNGNNGWTEKYDLMKDNSPGAAMMLGGDNVVSDNCLTKNGEYGFNGYSYVDQTYGSTFTGGATNVTFTGNDVSYNNSQKTQSGIEGGGKFWQDGNVVVIGNYVHGNIEPPGLWMDTDNAGFLVQGNYISDNDGEGLMYEISYNADIVHNTFVDNAIVGGEGNKGFPTGAIYISESGGNASVPSDYAGELNIQDNVFRRQLVRGGALPERQPLLRRWPGSGHVDSPERDQRRHLDQRRAFHLSLAPVGDRAGHQFAVPVASAERDGAAQHLRVQPVGLDLRRPVHRGQLVRPERPFLELQLDVSTRLERLQRHFQQPERPLREQHLYRPLDVHVLQSGRHGGLSRRQAGATNVESSGDNFGAQDQGEHLYLIESDRAQRVRA